MSITVLFSVARPGAGRPAVDVTVDLQVSSQIGKPLPLWANFQLESS